MTELGMRSSASRASMLGCDDMVGWCWQGVVAQDRVEWALGAIVLLLCIVHAVGRAWWRDWFTGRPSFHAPTGPCWRFHVPQIRRRCGPRARGKAMVAPAILPSISDRRLSAPLI